MPLEPIPATGLDTVLAKARRGIAAGDQAGAFAALRPALMPTMDFVDQARLAKLLGRIDLPALGLRPLRLALVGASTLDHLAPLLRYWLARAGLAAEIWIAPFDTVVPSILDAKSPLYDFAPDTVWLFSTFRDIELEIEPGADATASDEAVARAIALRRQLWAHLQDRLRCLILQNNADIPADDPFGNLAGAAAWGRRHAWHRYNAALAAAAPPGVVIVDLDHLAASWGRRRWTDQRYWFHSRHAVALDATGTLAATAARLIAGARGLAKKCLVLDLDNTLWGGVVADDGLAGISLGSGAAGEAFVAFQRYIKALKERGVILAVCSKNDHEWATQPFREHPDCVLQSEDFAAFIANWENKADNLRRIAHTLELGLDAMVFVDDNPLERDIVRQHLPEVEVVALPEDPALFVAALAETGWFEAISFSAEDRARGQYYASNAQRAELRASLVDMAAYLRSLEMTATIGALDPFTLPRIAQLIAKSNQFHLTGTRYGEAELEALAARPDSFVRWVRLVDRFGDNGLIAALVLRRVGRTLEIDCWVMSCRVLERTLEAFIADAIAKLAIAQGCEQLVGRYVRSAKNGLVAGLFDRLGFRCIGETQGETRWAIELVPECTVWPTFVRDGMPT